MTKVSFFLVCETIIGGTAGPVINTPLLILRPPVIPSTFSFGAVVGITGLPNIKSNDFQIRIYDPSNNKIYESPIHNLPLLTSSGSKIPHEYEGFIMGVDIRNLFFNSEGEYKFEFYLNGEKFGEYKIPVFARG